MPEHGAIDAATPMLPTRGPLSPSTEAEDREAPTPTMPGAGPPTPFPGAVDRTPAGAPVNDSQGPRGTRPQAIDLTPPEDHDTPASGAGAARPSGAAGGDGDTPTSPSSFGGLRPASPSVDTESPGVSDAASGSQGRGLPPLRGRRRGGASWEPSGLGGDERASAEQEVARLTALLREGEERTATLDKALQAKAAEVPRSCLGALPAA